MELNKEILMAYDVVMKEFLKMKKEENQLFEKFKENNVDFFKKKNMIEEGIDRLKGDIWVMAHADFKETGEKKLLGGIGIRVGVKLFYDDRAAMYWALDHKMCLKLDSRNFEKIAKTQEIDFVKKEEVITVTFPKEIKIEDYQQYGKVVEHTKEDKNEIHQKHN